MGKERVQKLMHLHGIRAKGKCGFKVATDSNHDLPIAANWLDVCCSNHWMSRRRSGSRNGWARTCKPVRRTAMRSEHCQAAAC